MSGRNFLIDTNIALYLLKGNSTVTELLDGNHVFVSFITELELLSFKGISTKEKQAVKNFLNECSIIDINHEIKELTISIRQRYGTKLPDSIIAATSIYLDMPLISADKGFRKISDLTLALFEEE